MKKRILILFLSLFTALTSTLFSNEKDSLLLLSRTALRDTNYIFLLSNIAGSYAGAFPDSTLWYAKEMYRISDSLNYKNGIGRSYFMTGLSYFVRGEEDSAMFWFQKTLTLFNETRDPDGLALAYHNIARLYSMRKELAKAKEYALIALELRKKINSPRAVISTITLLGLIAGGENNLQEEESYHLQALEMAKRVQPHSASSIGMALINLADIAARQKKYDKAKKYYLESLNLHASIRDISGQKECYIGLARVELLQRDYASAIMHAEKALNFSQGIYSVEGILKSAEILSAANEKIGNYQQALVYHKIHSALQDSINSKRAKKEYVNSLSRFETGHRETQIKILEQENQIQTLQRNIAAGILLVVLIGAGALYIRSKEIRKIETAQHSEELQKIFSAQLLAQQEQERKRISSELHDSLGQNLLIIKNMIDVGIQTKMPRKNLNEQLSELSEIASRSIEETRTIASNLHPYQLNRMGLTKAIIAMIRNMEHSAKITFKHSIDKTEGIFSKETEAHVYRIAQESVNNALKHADATAITVELKNNFNEVRLTISDNGKGFDVKAVEQRETFIGGLGLFGLRERARIIGGSFSLHSELGKGTTVEVVVPQTLKT